MPILTVKDLSVSFKNDAIPSKNTAVVKHISFSLEKGKILAIVGESGSGKSVTALSLLQLLPYPHAFHPSGSVQLEGKELMHASQAVLRNIRGNRIGMIFQEPMTSLNPLHTIYKQINEPLKLHTKLTLKERKERIIELLDLVELSGLKERLYAYPHELSGGQRQRVMIAMALAMQPDILIADEPTTALDVTVQAQILKLLRRLQQQLGMSLILITHDLTIVRKMADRVAVMSQGEIVEQGDVQDIFLHPQHSYTKTLLASEIKDILPAQTNGAVPILEAQHVTVEFPVHKNFLGKITQSLTAVDNVSLSLKEGKTLGIVGESGSGKTTLALAILRLIKSLGIIRFHGKPIHSLKTAQLRDLRKSMQIVFQDPFASLNPRMSVGQIIEEGLKAHNIGNSEKARFDLVCHALEDVHMDADMYNRYPHEFSGGQRQRVAIARALVLQPSFIVLDEPTSALDLTVQKQILELLKDLQQKYNLSLLFISHDLRVIRAISHDVIVMKQGKIVEHGSTQDIFECPQSAYTRALINAALDMSSTEGQRETS